MYPWFYKGNELIVFPLVAMFIFIAVFLAVVIRTYGRSRAGAFEAAAALPLSDDARRDDGAADTGDRHGH